MTDYQLMTLCMSIIVPISVMIYSNSRVSDVNNRINDLKISMDKQFVELKKHLDDKIDTAFEHMELLLKLHEAEHHKNKD